MNPVAFHRACASFHLLAGLLLCLAVGGGAWAAFAFALCSTHGWRSVWLEAKGRRGPAHATLSAEDLR